jgi:hypothetical protein
MNQILLYLLQTGIYIFFIALFYMSLVCKHLENFYVCLQFV